MGDHLPVPVLSKALFSVAYIANTQVIMDPVPEAALPEMVDYTPEVREVPRLTWAASGLVKLNKDCPPRYFELIL